MSNQILFAPQKEGFVSAKRLEGGFVSALEKAALLKLASATPTWINSDHLTILGFLAQCLAGICYGLSRWHRSALLLDIIFIIAIALGDRPLRTLSRVH